MTAYAFIPEIWSKKITTVLDKNLVAEPMCNRNYDGEVAEQGDKVYLWKPGTITISPYTKNTDLSAPQVPDPTEDNFTITQLQSFHFYVDRVDQRQGAIDPFGSYFDRASYALRDTIDQFILAKRTGFSASNNYTPAAATTSSNIYATFSHMHRLLDDSMVPNDGRRGATISPRVLELIRNQLESVASPLGDQVRLNGLTYGPNGFVGRYCDWNIYVSHNIGNTAENITASHTGNEVVHYCQFWHPDGITLVYQIPPSEVTLYQPELRFGRACKGLALYDAKVLDSGAYCGYAKIWWDA